jgi:hypothetical protein
VVWSGPETLTVTEWNGKSHLEHRYQENRADGEKPRVNYRCFETYNREKDKTVHKNSWITDKPVGKGNVRLLVECARAAGR